MNKKRSYFEDVVLPSVGLPKKPSYNLAEVCRIFGVHRTTLYRMIRDGAVTAVRSHRRDYRVYLEELRRYFSPYDEVVD